MKRQATYEVATLPTTFKVNQIVMVYYEEAHRQGESTKLISRWIGPYRIHEVLSDSLFRVQHISTEHEITTHISRLRRFRPWVTRYVPDPERMAAVQPHGTAEFHIPVADDIATKELAPGDLGPDFVPQYTVERILDKRTPAEMHGKLVEYLVKFRGYAETEWQPEGLLAADDLIDAYEKFHPPEGGIPLTRQKCKSHRKQRLKALRLLVDKARDVLPPDSDPAKIPTYEWYM